MAKYIECEALMEAVHKSRLHNPHKSGPARVAHETEHSHFLHLIAEAPAADVEPVVHAHWFVDDEYLTCSHCGESYLAGDTRGEVKFLLEQGDVHKFCHGCGAHMDEEGQNVT